MLDKHLIAKTAPVALDENIICWGSIRVSVLSPTLFRIEKDPHKRFCDKATQSVWFRNMPAVEYSAEISPEGIRVTTSRAVLSVKEKVLASCVIIDAGR